MHIMEMHLSKHTLTIVDKNIDCNCITKLGKSTNIQDNNRLCEVHKSICDSINPKKPIRPKMENSQQNT